MEIGSISLIISMIGTTISVVYLASSIWYNAKQIELSRKTNTLEYVTGQFDRLDRMGYRKIMRDKGEQDVMEYLANHPDHTQAFLEYIYTFNRIGAGIFTGSLLEDVIFNIWAPEWFEGYWKRFEALITSERKRRGEHAKGAYVFFDWLAKEKCPKVRDKYPQKSATT